MTVNLRRILAFLLVCALCVSLVPAAFAAEPEAEDVPAESLPDPPAEDATETVEEPSEQATSPPDEEFDFENEELFDEELLDMELWESWINQINPLVEYGVGGWKDYSAQYCVRSNYSSNPVGNSSDGALTYHCWSPNGGASRDDFAICLQSNRLWRSGDNLWNYGSVSASDTGEDQSPTSAWKDLSYDTRKKLVLLACYGLGDASTTRYSGSTGDVYGAMQLVAWEWINGASYTQRYSSNVQNIASNLRSLVANNPDKVDPDASRVYIVWPNKQTLYSGRWVWGQTLIRLERVEIEKPKTGDLSLTKTTEDGQNLSGWKFSLYRDSACTSLVSGPSTTNSSGRLTFSGLTAGTYYVKEVGHTNSATAAKYYCSSTNPQRVTITAGSTSTVRFENRLNKGTAKLVKTTNTGQNLSGWQIGIYTNAACTIPISGSPFTTGNDGTVSVTLLPGTYYAKEIAKTDSYWSYDTSVKTLNVAANQTATATFQNTQYGRIQFQKTTNTGNHLDGWVFILENASHQPVGEYTTDASGLVTTENLALGTYYVREKSVTDAYWQANVETHTVTVVGGQTVTDRWLNTELGLGTIIKNTNTEGAVAGWKFGIYQDAECKTLVSTLTTGEDGRASTYLQPGSYFVKEIGDTQGRFENEYWQISSSVQKLEIKAHEETSVTFLNNQYGKLKIVKAMEDGSSPQGWTFRISDSVGVELEGSPFATDEHGFITSARLLPGTYTVEEIIPADSLYQCISENPQQITVRAGETAEVRFVNAMVSGSIAIRKVNEQNEPLAGATFRLDHLDENGHWQEIGTSTSDASGNILWDGLNPQKDYRVMEVQAPDGYSLLKGAAFQGKISSDNLDLTITVVNRRGFSLPDTGVNTMQILQILSTLSISLTLCVNILMLKKKGKTAND